ncbi:hypothetical protein KYK29_22250, partial [Shinella daejeonensis]|uniref:hypothetical protein n=1 Tax=Shinella daejeonensis TaxID=659017 RepID=UPI0020C81D87
MTAKVSFHRKTHKAFPAKPPATFLFLPYSIVKKQTDNPSINPASKTTQPNKSPETEAPLTSETSGQVRRPPEAPNALVDERRYKPTNH